MRCAVRKLLPGTEKEITVGEIDALYDSFDDDHSGELDVSELKVALKKLQEASAKAAVAASHAHDEAESMRASAAVQQEVITATVEYEEAVAAFKQAVNEKGVRAQLGGILRAKGLKVSEIVAKWGGGKSGEISQGVFRKQVFALGVQAADEEVDELFNSIDDDGGGTLDASEVKRALQMLVDALVDSNSTIKKLKDDVSGKEKIAKAKQIRWRKYLEAEEIAAAEAAERDAAAAAAAAEAAEQARAAKAAAAKSKKSSKQAAETEFNRKILLKRAASQGNVEAGDNEVSLW